MGGGGEWVGREERNRVGCKGWKEGRKGEMGKVGRTEEREREIGRGLEEGQKEGKTKEIG